MNTDASPKHARQSDGTASPSPVEVRLRLSARKAPGKAWRAVSEELGFKRSSGAMLSRVAAGKQKPSPALYIALGLTPPARLVEVPAGFGVGRACKTCGEVHTTTMCPTKRKPRRVLRKWGSIRYGDMPGRDGDRL